ncbi:hypothetical protein, conserved, DUF192 family [Thermococcus kodakarensis KOD1]|uniref:UPF0127 protein TK1120 n=1 Tax=Thermococcus kodakarensis (strain ATCC BAA-918 / JCM 12380 / KOD1) TaxID=69014 RepID=Y1120_THEKO|nr:DUF192 domain-containing protein [Thermococcus kodakarensis]Q5JE64.1 RecName: Full=UPF0127 protein TK1120 [Thermococcus kodakarensis KOD1]WCN29071.1 DUF192 domain-containing protein [Thermococcus kodakarensis]WCN31376.1 DUF192 domain-containing protein [Thermococcus kodakarensis]BAD85309.1 hypothetical protein, conserved, DUF192 family [Thermococcus kodakarensis KOD1]
MIINETKGKAWHGKVKLADTFLKRFRGLMLVKNVNHALVFVLPAETRANASIHMFFMLSDIDVIWLDSSRRVVDFKTAKKWRLYTPKKAAQYIIEGPVGLIRTLEVEEGDLISWTPTEEREKAVPVKSLIPGKINLNGSKNSIAMVESVKEVKANEV